MRLLGKNILIVDDDPSLRVLLRRILENAGCTIEEAESVRAALDQIQKMLPDLIVLDLNMPEHDGFALLKFRQQNKLLHSIPILVLSASSKLPVVEKALAMGANQFLEKPLRANLVLQKIRYLFYSQQYFSYQFPSGEAPLVTAEINGLIVGQSDIQLKISSVAKFERGKPLQIRFDSYMKAGGSLLVGRVDNRRVEVGEGLYNQVLTLVGLSEDEKEKLRAWQRNL